jgi:energy-coupling factor transporter ATP-binding protein EcfA2
MYHIVVEHADKHSDAIRQFILNYSISEKGEKIVLTERTACGKTDEIELIRVMIL